MDGEYDTAVDNTVGIILVICSVFGVLSNFSALYYFYTSTPRGANPTFFKTVYTVTCVVDILLCLLLFPVIQTAFVQDRQGSLFVSSSVFCTAWSVLFDMSLEMSVFMVAMLSVSRQLLLLKPYTILNTALSWAVPAAYCLLTLTVKLLYLLVKVNKFVFLEQLMACVPLALDGTLSELGEPLVHLPNELILSITTTLQIGMIVAPISISSVLSLILIHQSKKHTASRSTRMQNTASMTVVTVTSLYIICNVPLFIYHVYFWMWNLSIDRNKVYMTNTMFQETFNQYFHTLFLQSYSFVLASRVFPAIDSALSPIVYFWRIKKYRIFFYRLAWNVGLRGKKMNTSDLGDLCSSKNELKLIVANPACKNIEDTKI